MTRAITLKGVLSMAAWVVRYILGVIGCILVGAFAGKIARYFGAPMEIRLLTFALVAGLSLVAWHFARSSEEG